MILVNLMTNKEGELKKFLDTYLKEDTSIDNDVMEWIYIYNDKKTAINIINALLNQGKNYQISLWVQINDEDLFLVKKENYHRVIEKINQINLNCNV